MSAITDIVKGLAEPVTDLISEFITDKDKAADLAFKVSTMAATQAHAVTLAQIGVNKSEAESGSLFKGGWRPAVGWVCGLALFNNFIVVPYAIAFGLEMPTLSMGELMPVLLGMLGLTAARSIDKKNGVAAR
jgi:hypothetical protein